MLITKKQVKSIGKIAFGTLFYWPVSFKLACCGVSNLPYPFDNIFLLQLDVTVKQESSPVSVNAVLNYITILSFFNELRSIDNFYDVYFFTVTGTLVIEVSTDRI